MKMDEKIMKAAREKGLLLEKDVVDFLESFHDSGKAAEFLDDLERYSGEKMITKGVLSKSGEFVRSFVSKLKEEDKEVLERTIVKLGLKLEVSKQRIEVPEIQRGEGVGEVDGKGREDENKALKSSVEKQPPDFKVFYADTKLDRKLEVKDFVGHFRNRYSELQRMLMSRGELQDNLISINKIGNDRQSLGVIGIVTEKRVTKNGNLIIKFEDLTGEINVLVKHVQEGEGAELFEKGQELQLDDVVGIRASGNRDMLFVHDIFWPDCFVHDKIRFEEDVRVAFLSDVHAGSDRHLSKSFEKFLDWISSDDEVAKKVKYIFFVGDNVDGVGIFPGQESVLAEGLKGMEQQYELLASYIKRIPKDKTIFMCPGQHDASRVAEPQPIVDRGYAGALYGIENLVLVTNPSMIKLLERGGAGGAEKELKILMYHGASLHSLINEIKELREIKAHGCPARAVRHLLKRRHLAPSHGEVVYIPDGEKDPLVIREAPDILCTGEVHRLDVDNYNGVLIVTGSCWQAQTDFEEKVGNEPDPCKVPVLSLKTRELKVYDFSEEGVGENGPVEGSKEEEDAD
jgi:DNA polymerase II small subunit